MVNNIIRVVFCFIIMAITLSYSLSTAAAEQGPSHIYKWALIPVALAIVLVIADIFWKRKKINVIGGLFFGTLSGLAIAFVLSAMVDLGTTLYGAPPKAEHPGPEPIIPAHIKIETLKFKTVPAESDDPASSKEDDSTASEKNSPGTSETDISPAPEKKKEPDSGTADETRAQDEITEESIEANDHSTRLFNRIYEMLKEEKPTIATMLVSMYIDMLNQNKEQLIKNRALQKTAAIRAYQQKMEAYQAQLDSYHNYRRYLEKVHLIKLILGAFSVFICITIMMQTKDEFRFIIPYIEFAKQTKGAMPLVLDTSVIIDGRICDIIKTKVIQEQLIIPRFVLGELQLVADSQDKLKRNRGRRGMDIIQKLQATRDVEIKIVDIHTPNIDNSKDVDTKLIALAQHLSGRIMTNDYNLNKLAAVRGVEVININDLTNALKPVVLPGEEMTIELIRVGESPEQGVGYLDDGTMVVVENGKKHIGSEVLIEVTSALQTAAGRMIFGRYIQKTDTDNKYQPKTGHEG